ncbi:hypothetical protein KI387_022029, partial [Taxus chinensis]
IPQVRKGSSLCFVFRVKVARWKNQIVRMRNSLLVLLQKVRILFIFKAHKVYAYAFYRIVTILLRLQSKQSFKAEGRRQVELRMRWKKNQLKRKKKGRQYGEKGKRHTIMPIMLTLRKLFNGMKAGIEWKMSKETLNRDLGKQVDDDRIVAFEEVKKDINALSKEQQMEVII